MTISGTATDPLINGNSEINGQTVTVDIVNAANTVVDSYTTKVSNGTWSVPVTQAQAQGLGDGIYTVTASVSDASGNPATAATQTVTVDTITPTVAVTTNTTDVNLAHGTATISFTFSEAPTSFSLADTTATGGTLGNLQQVDATHYTATFTANAGIDINNAVVGVTAGSWSENNGNPGAAGSTGNFTVDTITPTVAVTTNTTDVNLAHGTATISFTFSEAPTSFSLADTTATGGTLGNLQQVDATHYTATFTANAGIDINNAVVGVTAGSWSENNGNPGAAGSTNPFVVDTVTPKVALASEGGASENEANESWTLKGTYSDNGGPGVQSVQVFLGSTSGTYLGTATLSNGNWTLTTSNNVVDQAQLTFVALVTDNAGNTATTSLTVSDPAGVAGSPINLALTDPSGGQATGPITLTFTGVPSDWSLNQGTNLGNGTWTVQTNDLSALTVLTAAAYSGAMVLGVTETWTNANGSNGNRNGCGQRGSLCAGHANLCVVGQRHADWRGRQRRVRLRAADRQRRDLQFQCCDGQDRSDRLRQHCKLQ